MVNVVDKRRQALMLHRTLILAFSRRAGEGTLGILLIKIPKEKIQGQFIYRANGYKTPCSFFHHPSFGAASMKAGP